MATAVHSPLSPIPVCINLPIPCARGTNGHVPIPNPTTS